MHRPIIAPVHRPVRTAEWTQDDDADLNALLSGVLDDDPGVKIPDSGVLHGRIVA